MKAGGTDRAALLRWYPPAWRDRYGDELVALIEDQGGGRPPTFRVTLSLVGAGLRERAHQSGLVGRQGSPFERARTGSLVVLCAWTAFMVAGASFSKVSEHFAPALPAGGRAVAQGAFDVVVGFGITGMALVALGAAVALPSFVGFLGRGGWSSIRRHVLRAGLLSVVAVAVVVPLSLWAHHLNQFQRNGGDGLYSGAFITWALLVAGTLAQWTAAGVAAARRITFTRRVLSVEAMLAVALAGVMVVVTAATALWWGAMAARAPQFLSGAGAGASPSPFTVPLVLTMVLMSGAVLVAGYGVIRVARSWSGLSAA